MEGLENRLNIGNLNLALKINYKDRLIIVLLKFISHHLALFYNKSYIALLAINYKLCPIELKEGLVSVKPNSY